MCAKLLEAPLLLAVVKPLRLLVPRPLVGDGDNKGMRSGMNCRRR